MDKTQHRPTPADCEPLTAGEAELLVALTRSDADIAAGRVVPADAVHAELRAALDRITFGRLLTAAPIRPDDLPERDRAPLRGADFSGQE